MMVSRTTIEVNWEEDVKAVPPDCSALHAHARVGAPLYATRV